MFLNSLLFQIVGNTTLFVTKTKIIKDKYTLNEEKYL